MATTENLTNLNINVLTKEQLDDATVSENEIYFVTDDVTPIEFGGTGGTTNAEARTNLDVYSKGEVDNALIHNHDDRYYTESEVDSKLSGKSNTGHIHVISDVTDLQSSLDDKVDKVNGSRLITSLEAQKIESLVIDENGQVGISGTVNAENVQGLSDMLALKVDNTRKVNEKALSSDITLSASDVGAVKDRTYGATLVSEMGEVWLEYEDENVPFSLYGHQHTVADLWELTATATELNYVDGVTSNIQTQLNGKLSTSGGTVSGDVTMSGNLNVNGIQISGYNDLYKVATPTKILNVGNTSPYWITYTVPKDIVDTAYTEAKYLSGVTSNIQTQLNKKSDTSHTHANLNSDSGAVGINLASGSYYFRPKSTDYTTYCAGANYRWETVYAKNALNTSSDLNQKREINLISDDDRYVRLFDLIEPYSYKFKNGDRVHTGFISQYVESAMEQVGLTAEELGFFCKDIKTRFDEELQEDVPIFDEKGNQVYVYSLRYEEYISILTAKIKQQENKINKLESRLLELESKIK